MSDSAAPEPPAMAEPVPPHIDAQRPKGRIGWIITVIVLALALIASIAVLAVSLLRLTEALEVIEQQQEVVDEKEKFSSAMRDLMATASEFEGVPFGSIVPVGEYTAIAQRAWEHRWDVAEVADDTADIRAAEAELSAILAAATENAAGNATGTAYEATIDQLGQGFLTTVVDDADALCGRDVLACALREDPFVAHIDAASSNQPYMTDWMRTGVAYSHVAYHLQMTNPRATDEAVAAFGGDESVMADCFALTYLEGWTLHHTVDLGDTIWEVDLGTYTCDEPQREAIRTWYEEKIGYHHSPISQ